MLLRELATNISLSELTFNDDEREALDDIILSHRQKDRLKPHGLPPYRRILINGLEGSGKTSTAAAIAKALNLPLIEIYAFGNGLEFIDYMNKNKKAIYLLDQIMLCLRDEHKPIPLDSIQKHAPESLVITCLQGESLGSVFDALEGKSSKTVNLRALSYDKRRELIQNALCRSEVHFETNELFEICDALAEEFDGASAADILRYCEEPLYRRLLQDWKGQRTVTKAHEVMIKKSIREELKRIKKERRPNFGERPQSINMIISYSKERDKFDVKVSTGNDDLPIIVSCIEFIFDDVLAIERRGIDHLYRAYMEQFGGRLLSELNQGEDK